MFTCHRIEKRDSNGQLTVSGLEWTEGRLWLLNIWAVTMMVLTVAGVISLVCAAALSAKLLLLPIAILCAGALLNEVGVPQKRRQLLFHRDGLILAPLGFASAPRDHDRVDGKVSEIISIEKQQHVSPEKNGCDRFTDGVVLYLRNGGTCWVAKNLDPFDAHKVAVQLTTALQELRGDISSAARTGQAVPAQQSREPELID